MAKLNSALKSSLAGYTVRRRFCGQRTAREVVAALLAVHR